MFFNLLRCQGKIGLMFKEKRIFQKFATAVLITFMGIMVVVGIAAYSRTSGSTRQDMSQAHLVRKNALQHHEHPLVAEAAKE